MIDLAAIRRETGLTQTELAASLGVGQAQVSKIERQDDMLISTLASYLAALSVEAKIVVQMGDQAATYDLAARRGSDDDQTEITQRNHRRAVRFFWGLLTGAIAISLIGNITHALAALDDHEL